MRFRRLGKTDLRVSVVGLGTWQLAGVWDKQFSQQEVDSLFSRARELEINTVDTAECYGDHLAERLIGNAISGQRDDWIIATKFGHNPANDLGDANFGPQQVLLQLEASLRALQTDYIDIYQMHSATHEHFNNDELWTMLDKQVQAGKVRYLGNSLLMPQMRKQIELSEQYGISVLQTTYNALQTIAADTALPVAQQLDLGVIVREPLASGFLTGKYQPGHRFAQTDVRAMRSQEALDAAIEASLVLLQSKPTELAAAPWANAWCLQNAAVSVVIPGIKTLAQLESNALAAEALEALEALAASQQAGQMP